MLTREGVSVVVSTVAGICGRKVGKEDYVEPEEIAKPAFSPGLASTANRSGAKAQGKAFH